MADDQLKVDVQALHGHLRYIARYAEATVIDPNVPNDTLRDTLSTAGRRARLAVDRLETLQEKIERLERENEALRKDAEKWRDRQAALLEAMDKLPDGWSISFEVESRTSGIVLFAPDGDGTQSHYADIVQNGTEAEAIRDALNAALAQQAKESGQ
jgi:hypothetical protein